MNYEQKYKEALERTRKLATDLPNGRNDRLYHVWDLENIFPELKESKDERIKRCIGMCLTDATEQRFEDFNTNLKDCLAWLEKQGEQKPSRFKVGDKVIWIRDSRAIVRTISEVSKSNTYWLDCPGSSSGWYSDNELEPYIEQGEQKHTPKYKTGDCIKYRGEKYKITNITVTDNNFYYDVSLIVAPSDLEEVVTSIGMAAEEQMFKIEYNPADEFETKFKVGDWITNRGHSYLIDAIEDDRYLFEIGGYTHEQLNWEYIKNADEKYHLWTINDAEDGDVLASGQVVFMFKMIHGVWLNCYCSLHNDGSFIADSYDLLTDKYFSEVHPATKEQRELLFKKMKEAGYEWDAEKKELMKIEKESTWSEEDEKCFIELDTIIYQNSSLEDYNRLYHWLKSLKPNHWKPSEEQMEALKKRTHGLHTSSETRKALESLINDLEKLRLC